MHVTQSPDLDRGNVSPTRRMLDALIILSHRQTLWLNEQVTETIYTSFDAYSFIAAAQNPQGQASPHILV